MRCEQWKAVFFVGGGGVGGGLGLGQVTTITAPNRSYELKNITILYLHPYYLAQ